MSFSEEIEKMQSELQEVRSNCLATDTRKLSLLMNHTRDILQALVQTHEALEQVSDKVDSLMYTRGESMSPEQLSGTIRELTGEDRAP
jgi:hypothetical protein